MVQREIKDQLKKRLIDEPRRFIQALYGPRQVGKTTAVRQIISEAKVPVHYATADAVPASDFIWISQQWQTARLVLQREQANEIWLILDEIQKIENWSEQVKKEWDEDTGSGTNIKVVVLGSSRLILQRGLTESLAGRFEVMYVPHWSLAEMEQGFNFTHEQYAWFGGYPGPAFMIEEEQRWKDYIVHSLVEASISKDILMMSRIDKPALLKRLFELGCAYSGQILSYTKLLGQLQDAGNTTTLAHYLDLLGNAGLLSGIEKYAGQEVRQRASSPKFQVHNTALLAGQSPWTMAEAKSDPEKWGRVVESAIGAHLLNHSIQNGIKLTYWRERGNEVDFVLEYKKKTIAIEVKSGKKSLQGGMAAFNKAFSPDKMILVGKDGIHWQEFLRIPPIELF